MGELLKTLRGGRLAVAVLVGVGLVLLSTRVLVELYVDLAWFEEIGYRPVFWTRKSWFWGTRLVAGALTAVLLAVNLRIVATTLGGIRIKRRFGNLEIAEQLPKSYVSAAIGAIAGLLGLWFGASIPERHGWLLLMALRGGSWGLPDPVLGHDVSFYVFVLPLLQGAVTFALVLTFLVFSVVTGGYAATGAVRWAKNGVLMGSQPRRHLGAMVAVFVLLLAARFWLGRYVLLLDGTSEVQGIFGYTDAHARLPALRIVTVITVFSAAAIWYGAARNRLVPVLSGFGALVLSVLLVGQFFPSLVQRFQVEPNQLASETPYIEYALEFTRRGFVLHGLQRRVFDHDGTDQVDWERAASQFDDLPMWTRESLLTTFNETEARYNYYEFDDVEIDRYPTPDGWEAVAVSVREVDPGGIEDPNWQNLHLRERYITGMGAVAASAAGRTVEGGPEMLLSAIPPEYTGSAADPQLTLDRPQVFFGSQRQEYAVVNPAEATFLAPDGTPGRPGVDFPEGVALSSFVRVLAFAWYFREANLLFAGEVDRGSRIVFRRQLRERLRAIAPFFQYPELYPVVHEGRIVWIVEGFTASGHFPLSAPPEMPGTLRGAAWVRNSVKVTVDAVTGETRFYAVPVEDPLRDGYGRAFPGLLRPWEEMPEGLREHVRYPRALLDLQARVLLDFHQETAPIFHGQQDVWDPAQELRTDANNAGPYAPEYGLYALPGETEETFNLTTVFVPRGRQNLTALLAGRLLSGGRPELILYDVPVEDQVWGPRQVESLVEQDPLISQQFSLWRAGGGGSRVWTGHLHVVPVGGDILYVEPVFLAAEEDAIPELRRFVVSDGRRVAMEPTLAGAIAALSGSGPAREGGAGRPGAAGAAPRGPGPGGPAWPSEALELLDEAEARLRAGDYQGFGEALQRLRALLRGLSGGA